MTITAKILEQSAVEIATSVSSERDHVLTAMVTTAIYQTGAALVAAIDRNTEARKCCECERKGSEP